jgi:hypothetical protein
MPTAVLTPGQTRTSPLGAIVFLDARASVGTGLTYDWSVTGPIGSRVTTIKVIEPGLARLYPDVPGPYVVTVTVTEGADTSSASETIIAHATRVSPLVQVPPDASYMTELVSDFWSLVGNNQVLPLLWSGYTQTVASDFLRAYQINAAKSIQTIQPLFQRRWLSYAPLFSLKSNLVYFGVSQSGEDATTDIEELPIRGSIVSPFEFRVIEGQTSTTAESIIIDGTTYPVIATTSSTSYRGSFSFLPLFSGVTLATVAGSRIVFALGADFSAATEGDVLTIPKGTNAGTYVITRTIDSVDTTGIPSSAYFEVDRELVRTTTNAYQITQAMDAVCVAKPRTLTDTVFVPIDSLDVAAYSRSISGVGTVSRDTLRTEDRHIVPEIVGKEVFLTQEGSSLRLRATIIGFSSDNKSFTLSPVPKAGVYRYELPELLSIRDRVFCVEGRGHQIRSVKRLSAHWAVQLRGSTELAGRTNLSWRIGNTVEIPILDEAVSEDLAAQGVCAGDTFYLSVRRLDTEAVGLLPCQITGVANNKFGFEFGATELELGQAGVFTDEELTVFAESLGMRDVGIPSDADLTLTEALRIRQDFFDSGEFSFRHYNVPISSETALNIDDVFYVRVEAATVLRNKRIPALTEEDLLEGYRIRSIPALTEFIVPPTLSTTESTEYVQFTLDGEVVTLSKAPIALLENDKYLVESDITGGDAVVTAGSGAVTLPFASLTRRDVAAGDKLMLSTGAEDIQYYIKEVVSDTLVLVATANGEVPTFSSNSLRYRITRSVPGTFIRLLDTFTPQSPAPSTLWAQMVLFDNAKAVEENFGTLVGFTRKIYEDYSLSQISYDAAVRALMYAWANGPTVSNLEIASHIYLSYPVTETLGRIIDIDPDAETLRGQILIEDLRSDGTTGTGLVRAYYYAKSETDSLPEFLEIAINPRTGEEFAIGDVVPAFTPLTTRVLVEDRLINPEWWKDLRETALVQYHSWQVVADLATCDSRDLGSLADFLSEIRPIYTKPILIGVVFLRDEVSSFATISQEGVLRINDTPAFDAESALIIDSYNESSASTRLLNLGIFRTVTLFEGDDLTILAGSDVVSSARGGFTSPITYINSVFDAEITTVGDNLVEIGDYLWVRTGLNMGRFRITEIISDTELRVERAIDDDGIDYPPRSMDPTDFVATDSDKFQIQRRRTDLLPEDILTPDGDTDFRVERLLAEDVVTVELTPDALFTISGVTASCSVDLEAAGIMAGDMFIFDDTEYAITAVSGGILTLATAPPASSGPGLIRRSV